MRVKFNSIEFPKKAAKRLQKSFQMIAEYIDTELSSKMFSSIKSMSDYKPIEEISLSKAQAYTAEMLGYRDWHELEEATKLNSSINNKFDEDVSEDDEIKRRYYQWEILDNYYKNGYVNQIVFSARVSAKNPLSEQLSEDLWFKNYMYFDKDDGNWEFHASMRSGLNRKTINEIQEDWSYNHNIGQKCLIKSSNFLSKEPENITAIWLYLCVIVNDINLLKANIEKLNEFESQIMLLLSTSIEKSRIKTVNFRRMGNRDFLRVTVMIADAFFQLEDYDKANYWFNRISSMTNQFNDSYRKEMAISKKKKTGK